MTYNHHHIELTNEELSAHYGDAEISINVDDFLDDDLELEPHHREALDDFDYDDFPHM